MLRRMRFRDCKFSPFEYISFNHPLMKESPCVRH
jgi:hypothetical protein